MTCSRIYSTMIDDGAHQPDKLVTIIIHARLTEDGRIDKEIEAFGYSKAWNDESSYQKYPFILSYEGGSPVTGKVDYAGWDRESDNRINIYSKHIVIGETFTFVESSSPNLEYVYRIESITKI